MISNTSIRKLPSYSELPPVFDIKATKEGGTAQVLLYNNNMAPQVQTFSSVYLRLEKSLELPLATQRKLKNSLRKGRLPNASGLMFHEMHYHSALSLQSLSAFGNDMVQSATEKVSPMDFPQRLMPRSTFEDHLTARRLFYAQRFRAKGTSKRVALDYARYQPLRRTLRENSMDEMTEVYFYLPLGKHASPKFCVILVDEKGRQHRLEGSLGTKTRTFTSNWTLSLLVGDFGVDPSIEFFLTNVVLDDDRAQHFFCCNSCIDWPRLFMIECTDCACSLSFSQYCSGKGFCAFAKELLENGVPEFQIKVQMAEKRAENRLYNRSLEKYRLDRISLSTILLAEQTCKFSLSDVEIAMIDDESFVCRMGTELFILYVTAEISLEKRLTKMVTEIFEYTMPDWRNVVCCSPIIDNKCFYYVNTSTELHYFDLQNDLGREKNAPLKRDFCEKQYLPTLRIFSGGNGTIVCYYAKEEEHGLIHFKVSL